MPLTVALLLPCLLAGALAAPLALVASTPAATSQGHPKSPRKNAAQPFEGEGDDIAHDPAHDGPVDGDPFAAGSDQMSAAIAVLAVTAVVAVPVAVGVVIYRRRKERGLEPKV